MGTPLAIKCQKSPYIPCVLKKKLFKVKGQNFLFFFIFLEKVKFFENITQTKIVDNKVIYKKGPHTLIPKDHHS